MLALPQPHPGQAEEGPAVFRLVIQELAVNAVCAVQVSRLGQEFGLFQGTGLLLHGGGPGHEGPQDFLYLLPGKGPGELFYQLAVLDDLDGGDALDPEGHGQLLVVVHVDLGQHGSVPQGGDDLGENGAQGAAGSAPGSPEVHHHQALIRALDHHFLEVGGVDLDDLWVRAHFHLAHSLNCEIRAECMDQRG